MQIVCLKFLLPFESTFVQVLEDVQAEHDAESPGNVPSRAEPVLSVVKTVLGFWYICYVLTDLEGRSLCAWRYLCSPSQAGLELKGYP